MFLKDVWIGIEIITATITVGCNYFKIVSFEILLSANTCIEIKVFA